METMQSAAFIITDRDFIHVVVAAHMGGWIQVNDGEATATLVKDNQAITLDRSPDMCFVTWSDNTQPIHTFTQLLNWIQNKTN